MLIPKQTDISNTSTSTIYLPIELEISSLKQLLNEQIGTTIYDGYSQTKPNFKIKVNRKDTIDLSCIDEVISYTLPLEIMVSKGRIKVVGTVLIYIETEIHLQQDWEIKTRTKLHQFQWITQPNLHLGAIKIPIKRVLNKVLATTKTRLEDQIDDVFRTKIQLKTRIQELWAIGQQTLRLHQEYPVFLALDTNKVQVTPFKTDDDSLKLAFQVSAFTQLYVGKPSGLNQQNPLLNLHIEPIDAETSNIQLATILSYETLVKYGMEYVKGKEFDIKGQKINIQNIEAKTVDGQLHVQLVVSGDLNGTVSLSGIPNINHEQNRLEIKDLAFDFSTENLLHKTAAWLIKGEVLKFIKKNLDAPLDEKMVLLQSMINMQLFQLTSSIKTIAVRSTLKKLSIESIKIEQEQINMDWEALADLSLKLQKKA